MARTKGSHSTRRSKPSEGQARCWLVMRYLTGTGRGFTVAEVAGAVNEPPDSATGAPGFQIGLTAIRHYLKALERSGHVRKVAQGRSGVAGSFDTWRVVRNNGPEAPILHRNRKGVYDPNTGEHFPAPERPHTHHQEVKHEKAG